jgi:hypothetical protein
LSLPVVLSTTDSDKPSLDNSSIKVTQQEWWYAISFAFVDKTSWVSSSVVKLPDGTKQNFKWNTVKFTTSQLWVINYSAVDLFGNQIDGTIDLNQHIAW